MSIPRRIAIPGLLVAAALAAPSAGASDDGSAGCLPDPVGFGVSVGQHATVIVANEAILVDGRRARRLRSLGLKGSVIDGLDIGGGRGLATTNENELVVIDRRGVRRHGFHGTALDVDRGAVLGLTPSGHDANGVGQLAVRFVGALGRSIALPVPPTDFANSGYNVDDFAADEKAAWVTIGKKLVRVGRDGTTTSTRVNDTETTVYADGNGGAWNVDHDVSVRVIGADGRQRRRIKLDGDSGITGYTHVVAGGRLHILQSRRIRGRDSVELLRIDRTGHVERLAHRRAARSSAPPRILAPVGSGVVMGWTESGDNDWTRPYFVGSLTRPVRVPGVLTGIFRHGSGTLVLSSEERGSFARELQGGRLGRALRVGGPCL